MTVYSATLLIFLVLDPFGNIPFFLAALRGVAPARQKTIIARELLFALVALVLFLFTGHFVLQLLGISEPSLTVAGGVILFLIAVRMIFPSTKHSLEEDLEGEPFIVPLAIPYVAGPSALASVMVIMNREADRWPYWLLATVLAWLGTAVIVFLASGLRKFLGKRGLVAMERLMGMVLITLAVQMLLTGIAEFLTEQPR
jgi:MarC family membrane protein